jgi:hypothetical protein
LLKLLVNFVFVAGLLVVNVVIAAATGNSRGAESWGRDIPPAQIFDKTLLSDKSDRPAAPA